MNRARASLLGISVLLLILLVGGGLAVRVGAADGSYRQVLRFSEVLALVLDNYVDPVDADDLLEGAYEGMLGGLDADGSYLTAKEVEEWLASDPESDADPGLVTLKSFGSLQVVRVLPGSPAEAAGVLAGDQIRRIADRPLRDVSFEQAVRMLRGKPGTTVSLGILRTQGGLRREEDSVKRAKRTAPAFRAETLGETLVFTVSELPRVAREEAKHAIGEAIREGATRVLLDLRDVVDGRPRDAAPILGLFVSGELLRLRDRSGQVSETVSVDGTPALPNVPVAVLVNHATAGGAEAVAHVLRVRRQAPVYGETTYGDGSESKLFRLASGAGLLLPALVWESSGGERWMDGGVRPDEVLTVAGPAEEAPADQLRRALEAFEKATTPVAAKKAAA